MCEHPPTRTVARRNDEGFTLIELLVTVVLMGLVMAGMSSAIVVTLRQASSTGGRLNVARSEQLVSMWLPADLASAQSVDTSPSANPCRPATCPPSGIVVGSNALLLEWTSKESNGSSVVERLTRVAYVYAEIDGEFKLVRVECSSLAGGAWTCKQSIAVHDLDPPPPNVNWQPGITVPSWVIIVTEPLDPEYAGGPTTTLPVEPGLRSRGARRVVVTINGGGDTPGAGGGSNQVSLSAGGASTYDLDTASLLGAPSFTAARSRCGGNLALIVDESASIGSTAIVQVRDAIANFVTTFAGTPVKLEIVRFDTKSSVLGASGWSRWFNMLDDGDVTQLSQAISQLRSSGGTNWEDAWFRTFFNSDGTVQATIPDLVVFFTDGVPTYSRLNQSSATAPTTPPAPMGYPLANGSAYNQEAWIRADHIARQFRSSVRFIGVGIGPDITGTSSWLNGLPTYERGYHLDYQRYGVWYERSNKILWQRSDKLIYEQLVSGSWVSRTRAQYDAGNTVPGESDGWRTRVGTGTPSWTAVATTQDQYMASNTSAGEADGWRTAVSSTSNVTWTEVPQSEYSLSNTTSDANDGWRTQSSATAWSSTTAAIYQARNTTPDESDGWRVVLAYSSPYDLWEAVPWSVYNATPSAGRRTNTSSMTTSTSNGTIITRLIGGNDFGVPALLNAGGGYSNAAEANMFISPNWSDFTHALQAIALAECGGTLTLQTRVGTAAASDPFTYQNTAITKADGSSVPTEQKVVSTTRQFVSGTFDFGVPDGQYLTIEIQPQNLSDLTGYQPAGWSCRAGASPRPVETFAIPGTTWPGMRVRVGANEAVSCVQQVTRG
jgi:prepilin-type N-terminal cleavage/methylation domain-containing protein